VCNWCHVTMMFSAWSDLVWASDMVGIAVAMIGDQLVTTTGMRWIGTHTAGPEEHMLEWNVQDDLTVCHVHAPMHWCNLSESL
jgi:hypothetical protein